MTLAEIIDALRHIRTHTGASHRANRRRLLRLAASAPIETVRVLLGYHELLLFALAFPDDRDMHRMCTAELVRVARTARAFVRRGRRRDLDLLTDSGIANTTTHCRLSIETSSWLARRFPRDTEIAWADGSGGAGLDAMLATVVDAVESDGLADTQRSTQQWFALARGKSTAGSDLLWLLDHFEALNLAHGVRDHVFDLLELEIRWRHASRLSSRTFARLPGGRLHCHGEPLQRGADLEGILGAALPPTRPLPKKSAELLIDIARAALAVRHRETDPVTYADPRDVTLFDMGRGISVALFGHKPAHRETLNAYYGFVLAKNRVPMAYGGGWMFFDRCEIGINVFDAFRGGESAVTFAQLLRLYHHHFKVRLFTVEPYQFGADNPEAIRSAAIWFYYRFGFRPRDAELRALAEREWQRLRADPGHRTSAHILRRLTGSFLELDLGATPAPAPPEPAALSLAVTQWIGQCFGGDRKAARASAGALVRRALNVDSTAGWTRSELRAFDDLCLLAAPLSGLATWNAADKRALVAVMRAKGGTRERTFALRLARHARLRAAWDRLVATVRT